MSSTMNRAPVVICSAACRTAPESAAAASRSAACWSGVMCVKGRSSHATPKPMRIAASVVPQKNASVRMPSRPTRRRSPSPATPANSAVATSGITTIDSRFKNSVPSGRSHCVSASREGHRVMAAATPNPSPAPSPSAIQTWLPIDRTVLFPGTMITGAITLRNRYPLATPAKRSFRLTGATGSPVAVEVTSGGGQRPVTVLCGPLKPGLAERLARAGFAVVSFDPPGAPGLEIVLDALGRGVFDVDADSYALIEPRDDGSIALARAAAGVRVPGLVVGDMPVDLAAAAIVQWLAKHLV